MMLAHRHIRGSFLESGFRRTEDMRKRGGGRGYRAWGLEQEGGEGKGRHEVGDGRE